MTIWLGLLAATVYGSLAPSPEVNRLLVAQDKLLHASAYALVMFWFVQLTPRQRWRWSVAAVLWAGSGLIEYLQWLTGYRQAEWRDFLANGVGIAVALILGYTPLGGLLALLEGRLCRHPGRPANED